MAHRTVEHRPAADGRPPLEIQRSRRRRKTANAYAQSGTVVVQLPAGLGPVRERRLIRDLVARVTGRRRAEDLGGDDALAARAAELADRYLDGVEFASVTWSSRLRRGYGSCTSGEGTIRISDRVARFPPYVRDYVIVHELAHLVAPGHGGDFRALVDRFPQAERARGFLAGLEHAAAQPPEEGRARTATGPASGPAQPPAS